MGLRIDWPSMTDVVYVDGVRTAFGKAGPGGLFWRTRADDMAVKAVRELLRRNSSLPPERIADVIFAATAQVGDQGLTLGRDVALLAGIPETVPGFAVDGWKVAERDEFLRPETTLEGLEELRTPFRPGGRVTAGNSAGLTDGATAGLIASAEAGAELGLDAKMRLVGFAYAGVEPHLMGLGPVPATEKLLAQTGVTLDEIGLFELNEPFAGQLLTWCDALGVDPEDPRLNPYGGAIACGHPLAATGVRLLAQLAYGFEERPEVRYGLAALCVGMGMGAALLWENLRLG